MKIFYFFSNYFIDSCLLGSCHRMPMDYSDQLFQAIYLN